MKYTDLKGSPGSARDADGVENGTIVDLGALALTSGGGSSSSNSGGVGCFIKTVGGELRLAKFFSSFLR